MQVISDTYQKLNRDVVLTIGSFDGVHRGHQQLLRELIRRAREQDMLSAALTFYPHPRVVLRPGAQPRYLTTDAERARILDKLGLDLLVLLYFNQEAAETPADHFVHGLYQRLRMRELWVGADFRLGKERKGDIPMLSRLGQDMGYRLQVVEPVYDNGKPISSTRIRQLLDAGQVRRAADLLGRYYGLSGIVLHGARRGRRLGFRTANLRVRAGRAAPADGVYAVWACAEGAWYQGVANIGRRPSFDAGERLLEVHLLGYQGDLYGQHLRVEFVERLRGERRFEDSQALSAQVQEDIHLACEILGQRMPLEQG